MTRGRTTRIATALLAVLTFAFPATAMPVPAIRDLSSGADAIHSCPGPGEIDPDAGYVEGEVIVRFKPGVSAIAARSAHARAGCAPGRAFDAVKGLYLARLSSDTTVESAIAKYEAMPEVAYAQPNYIKSIAAVPNDPLFGGQWGLDNTGQTGGTPDADIDAVEAWDYTTGSGPVMVAVLDSGVDYEHPDLDGNMWTNPGEIAGNGIDDDANGYIDDVHGYDVVNDDGDPMDDNGHGTHCAGTIAAEGNNAAGIAGVDWDVSIIAVKVLDAQGLGTTAQALEAYAYVAASGAHLANASWGGYYPFDQAEYDALRAIDTLFVFAAGNNDRDIDAASTYYPAGYDLPNILSVGATDANDARAAFSNYGATSVDLFAPGVAITSTVPGRRTLALAEGTTVNPILLEDFSSLDAWSQIPYGMGYPFRPWTLDTASFVSAPTSVANLGYVNRQRSQLRLLTPLDLSTSDYPGFRFRARRDVEPNADFLRWGVWDQSAGALALLGMTSGDSAGAFETITADLGAYAGQTDIYPYIEIRADTAIDSADGYEGVWIDDFEAFDLDPAGGTSPWLASADFSNAYESWNGTSMAAPHVTGVAALLMARDPSLATGAIKAAITGGVDAKDALALLCVSGGRLNALGAIALVNRAPVATSDAHTIGQSTQLRVAAPGVIGNDSDADGDPLAASLLTGAAHGSVELDADGSFVYTPVSAFIGTDIFTYRASDGLAYSDPTTVTVGVQAAPVPAPAAASRRIRPVFASAVAALEETGGPIPASAETTAPTDSAPAGGPVAGDEPGDAANGSEPASPEPGGIRVIPCAIGSVIALLAVFGAALAYRRRGRADGGASAEAGGPEL